MQIKLYNGDCLDVLKTLPDNSIDSVVTDPPYGLGKEPDAAEVLKDWVEKGYHEIKTKGGFMGNEWDNFVPQPVLWREVYRVLKPGGHLLSFAGTRTYDWMVMGIRLAGFEIRDRIQFLFDDSEYRNEFLESLSNEQKTLLGQILKNGDNETCWCYGSGFPKSLNISKVLDKQAGAEREVIGAYQYPDGGQRTKERTNSERIQQLHGKKHTPITAPSTSSAKQWSGWGTALKPANEPILLARKPLEEKTVAENVLKYGTGGINIDDCRIEHINESDFKSSYRENIERPFVAGQTSFLNGDIQCKYSNPNPSGRFPANLILSHSEGCKCVGTKKVKGGNDPRKSDGSKSGHNFHGFQDKNKHDERKCGHNGFSDEDGKETVESWECVEGCPVKMMDEQSFAMGMHSAGNKKSTNCTINAKEQIYAGGWKTEFKNPDYHKDTGGASRFFYCAKTSTRERNFGLDGFEEKAGKVESNRKEGGKSVLGNTADGGIKKSKNHHPTVKPIALMKYLIRLITPENGMVLDPFMGSGTTGCACAGAGFNFTGIEREKEYMEIAQGRINSYREDEWEDDALPIIAEEKTDKAGDIQMSFDFE